MLGVRPFGRKRSIVKKVLKPFTHNCKTQSRVYFYFPGTMTDGEYSFLLFDIEVTRTLRTLAVYISNCCRHVGVRHL